MKYFTTLPLGVKIAEVLCALSVVVYLYFFWDGGFFTTYYALMAAMIICAGSSVYLAFRRYWLWICCNLLLAFLCFLHFILLAG